MARGRVSVSVGRLPTVADSPAVGDTRLMEYEPERTVPPSLRPPEQRAWVEQQRLPAGEWGQPGGRPAKCVCWLLNWYVLPFLPRPAKCMYPLPFAREGATWKGLKYDLGVSPGT